MDNLTRSQHDVIDEERQAAFPEASELVTWRDYYAGEQKGTLTPQQSKTLRGALGHRFCDNVCAKVINEVAGRHELSGFQVDDEDVADFLDALWVKNALAELQQEVGLAVLRDGNHALALRWLPEAPPIRGTTPPASRIAAGRVTIHQEPWWDGTSGMFVAYGSDGRPSYAVKDWQERTPSGVLLDRRTIFFPDHLERWVGQGDGWQPFSLASDPAGTGGSVPWVRRDGTPLGLPVIHFAAGSNRNTPYGASLLDGGVLGLQDEVNDIQRDITAAARLTAFQMLYATGTAPQTDEQGKAKPMPVGPGQVLQSPEEGARYGVLPAGDLTQLASALLVKIRAICRMTDCPLHVITGEWPSGAALLRSEMPLVGRATRLNRTTAPAWATVAHRSTELANTFGDGVQLDEEALITAEFVPPERLDALTLAQVDKTKAEALVEREKLNDRVSLQELGLTDEQIDEILGPREAAAERAAQRQAALVGALAPLPSEGPTGPTGVAPNGATGPAGVLVTA